MRRILIASAAACACLAVAAPLGGAASNRPATPTARAKAAGPIHAPVFAPAAPPVYFEGRQIDLKHGAGASLDCVIYLTHGSCFRTIAEMKADEARVAALPTADGAAFPSDGRLLSMNRSWPLVRPLSATLLSCSAPLSVWTDEAYNGTEKDFAARQIWRNMTDYGINDQISSFIVGQCSAHLAENVDGGGLWYPCDTSAGAHHREMDLDDNNGGPPCAAQSTNWNDRVSSTWLN